MEWDKFKKKKKIKEKEVDEPAKVDVIDHGKIRAISETGRRLDVSDETEERALRAVENTSHEFFWGGCQPEGDGEIVCRFGVPQTEVDVGLGKHKLGVNIQDLELEVTDFNQLLVRYASELEKKDGVVVIR